MYKLNELKITWDGSPNTSFHEDLIAQTHTGIGLGAHLLVVHKKTGIQEQIAASGIAATLLPTIEQQPVLTGIIGTILLAAISPVTLEFVTDSDGWFLTIINKSKTGDSINEERLHALLATNPLEDNPLIEELIQSLCDKNYLRRNKAGKLKIQRKVLANIKIGG